MRYLCIAFLALISFEISAQELFVVTDPASNVPAGSLNVRLGQSLFNKKLESGYDYNIMPEITWGLNKNLMFRATAFVSNQNTQFVTEGASFYSKYRIYSTDDLNSHFRLAAYGRYSFNNADIEQEQIEILGSNTGFETGIIATKLIKKVAISSSISFEKALDNRPSRSFPSNQGDNATNYSLSFGKLMYPKKYTSYKQTNINLMVEFVGQTINENGKSYLDAVPAVQFIINSQARIDVAYKHELYSSMVRSAPNGLYLNLEYTFFNVSN